jgi:uncharacterized membrane protein YciS (DUF1049 family)
MVAIAFSVMLSALYVYKNSGDIYVNFLLFEKQFPQGIWEALLFSSGVVLMWIFSLLASLEGRSKYMAKIKERDVKITQLEEEKKSLLAAFNHLPQARIQPGDQSSPEIAPDASPLSEITSAPEEKKETVSL